MALSKIDAANFLTGTIPQGNVANASLGAVTALPGAIVTGKVINYYSNVNTSAISITSTTATAVQSPNITPALPLGTVNLSAGDYIEVYFRYNSSSGNAGYDVGQSYNRFSGFKLIE